MRLRLRLHDIEHSRNVSDPDGETPAVSDSIWWFARVIKTALMSTGLMDPQACTVELDYGCQARRADRDAVHAPSLGPCTMQHRLAHGNLRGNPCRSRVESSEQRAGNKFGGT
jgi:hypothetical protein